MRKMSMVGRLPIAIALILVLPAVSAADAPAVPSLPLDSLPPAARERVAAAYRQATAEPAK